jgi:hypothetical protein
VTQCYANGHCAGFAFMPASPVNHQRLADQLRATQERSK